MRHTPITLVALLGLTGACNQDHTGHPPSQEAWEVTAEVADALACVQSFMLDVHANCMGISAEPYPAPEGLSEDGIARAGHPDGDDESSPPPEPEAWPAPEDQCAGDDALATVVDGRRGALRTCLGTVSASRCVHAATAPCLPFFDDDRCVALRDAAAAECQLAALASL